jgi:SAM-dependent methyltransferase
VIDKLRRLRLYWRILTVKEAVLFAASKIVNLKVANCQTYLELIRDKAGIEIGGPSECFRAGNVLPIYPVLRSLDGVNVSSTTIWEGALSEGTNFNYDWTKPAGRQFIRDAVSLDNIPSEKYDFLVACNSLEHIANPIRALTEWLRVVKSGGLLFLVLPNKKLNFDHMRDVTNFDHLMDDFKDFTTEHDLTHLDEILALHDLTLDPEAGTLREFSERAARNHENRALHHHVFDLPLLVRIFDYFALDVLVTSETLTDHYIVGRKP